MDAPILPPDELMLLAERYADHDLSPAEYAAFAARLQNEPAAQAALAEHQRLVVGIRAAGRADLRARFARIDQELGAPLIARSAPTPAAPVAGRVVRMWPRLAAAATVLLVSGSLFWLLRGPNPQAVADQYGLRDPGLPVVMSETLDRPLIAQAMNAYKTDDYEAALGAWDRLSPTAMGADTLAYYRGIFLLRAHRPTEARSALTRVSANPRSALRERADYYQALALLADGQTAAARAAFTRLANQPGYSLRQAARDILVRIP